MKFKQHPLSAAFPSMQADEYQSLVDSIGEIGVQNPITLFEGMVIDGWHRYTAANDAGMACPTVELGDVDPRDFVLAQNKARRNLTASQRAAAVTSVYEWAPAHREKKVEVTSTLSKTNSELAAIAGVSTKTIQQAKVAHKAGLTDAVKAGALSVEQAAKIATGKPLKTQAKPAHIAAVVEPEPEAPADYTELDSAFDQIAELQSELVIARMGNATDEEKQQAAALIAELRADIKTLTATLASANNSRDSLMEENAQMKTQMQMQRKEIAKLKNSH